MLRHIVSKTLSFSAITAAGLSLLVFNPSFRSGFSEAQASSCNEYLTCMGSCMPACAAWYNGYATYEQCVSECEAWYCGPNPGC